MVRVRTILRWASDGGLEHARVSGGADGFRAEGVVIGPPGDAHPFAVVYRLVCDADWRTRELDVRLVGTERRLVLRSDGNGDWRDGKGAGLPALRGCVDVDLTATPLTNTLPIRRLSLATGQSAVVRVAYVSVPELTVSVSEQRYTRRAGDTYRFELTDGSFTRDITVDAEGFVVDYPGLFRRQRAVKTLTPTRSRGSR
jgi:hypothetical protein